jgi:hypothetical protein
MDPQYSRLQFHVRLSAVCEAQLSSAGDRSKRLNRYSYDIVVRLLCGQGVTACLGVKAHLHRLKVLGMKLLFHNACLNPTSCTKLRYFLKKIIVTSEKER